MYTIKIYFGKFKKILKILVVKITKEGNFLCISNENGDITICVNISEIRVHPSYEFLFLECMGVKEEHIKKSKFQRH